MSDLNGQPPLSPAFESASIPEKPSKRGNKRERLICLRLTFAEHAALVQAAGNAPLGVYIRSKVFDKEMPEYRPKRCRQPVKDHQVLGQVLGLLGKSRLSNNVNQLAKAVNSGSLPVTPETERALLEACAGIAEMRKLVMQGLGFSVDGGPH